MTVFGAPHDGPDGRSGFEVGVGLRATSLAYLVFDFVGNSVIASLAWSADG